MRLVDGELEYQVPYGAVTGERPSVKQVDYSYEFTDHNARLRMGRGPTAFTVTGVCTSAELETLQYATQAEALYTVYFPSAQGGADDRYYQRVSVMPAQSQAYTADLHAVTIECHALDGYKYDAATGAKVN